MSAPKVLVRGTPPPPMVGDVLVRSLRADQVLVPPGWSLLSAHPFDPRPGARACWKTATAADASVQLAGCWVVEKPPGGWPHRQGTAVAPLAGIGHGWPSFTCPRCGRTSWHPEDVAQGYCGACHTWTRGRTR